MKILHRAGRVLYADDSPDLKTTLVAAVTKKAVLREADLGEANLRWAKLDGADLVGADLGKANLGDDTMMPDGRAWKVYRADHFAGVCDSPAVRKKALAAWGKHSWQDCPLHAALGLNGPDDAPVDKRLLVGCWVAVYDAGLLPAPPKRTPRKAKAAKVRKGTR